MKIVHNLDKYISQATIDKCFDNGQHNYVDKVLTGNGFSTAFLTSIPPEGMINIMIAPNRSVVRDKEWAIKSGKLTTDNTVSFYYKGSEKNMDSDVMVFVLDSFVLYRKKLKEISHRIHRILVDECHSIEIQSSFRYNLRDFDYNVGKYLTDHTSIVSVTASPNLGTPINIEIDNRYVNNTLINVCYNFDSSIERVKQLMEDEQRVIIFTNNKNIPYIIRNEEDEVHADFIVGETLARSIREVVKVRQNTESKLKIISSTGFEGIDIYGDDWNVFFFEDRGSQNNTFYFSNLYQAISRTRDGAKYIEYCRVELLNKRKKKPSRAQVQKFVDNVKLSPEQKQTKEFAQYKEFTVFYYDSSGKFQCKVNRVAVDLWKETLIYDQGIEENMYMVKRRISLKVIDKTRQGFRKPRPNEDYMIETLADQEIPPEMFGEGYRLEVIAHKKISEDGREYIMDRRKYLKELQKYFRRKNFDGKYKMSGAENVALTLFLDQNKLNEVVDKVTEKYVEVAKASYSRRKAMKKIATFTKTAEETVRMLIQAFVSKEIIIPNNYVGHRSYNIATRLKPEVIAIIGDMMDVKVTSIDIRNAFPRILYAINGKTLPEDFYGKDKENKVAINVLINDFFYRSDLKSDINVQVRNSRRKLRAVNFDEGVIEFMMEKFFISKFRGDMFNFLAYHERMIMRKLRLKLEDKNNRGVCRRHDEALVFDNEDDLDEVVRNISYLNVKGWF